MPIGLEMLVFVSDLTGPESVYVIRVEDFEVRKQFQSLLQSSYEGSTNAGHSLEQLVGFVEQLYI